MNQGWMNMNYRNNHTLGRSGFIFAGLALATGMETQAAVLALPPAPSGYHWELVSSGNTDSDIVATSTAETNIDDDLSESGSATAPIDVSLSASETLTLTAFTDGVMEPATYEEGDMVNVVTSNTYSTSFSVSSSAGISSNPDGDLLLVESGLNSLDISSSEGTALGSADLQSALNNTSFFLVSPNANSSASDSGSLTQINGETIDFTYSAGSSLSVTKPQVPAATSPSGIS